MTLDDIIPDTVTLLTEELLRLFRYADCEPECHACHKPIEVGKKFQLATRVYSTGWFREGEQESRDVMLCSNCTILDLIKEEKRARRAHQRYRAEKISMGLSGYSRPSCVR